MFILDSLNPVQRQAVTAGDGPLLILAGAGSGKTRVLTYRIAWLIKQQHVHPAEILAITFTNKAAREMQERLQQLVPDTRVTWVSTFHSACVRILRQDGERLGLGRNFVIYDTSEQTTLIKSCMQELEISSERFKPNALLGAISRAKNELKEPRAYSRQAADYFEETVARVYERYQSKLQHNNAVDFDDLLLLTVQLLDRNPDVREFYQNKFKYILVDEYQDTNHAQYSLVRLLAAKHRNLLVVGDDDQSIYAFRGADLRNILEFEKDFPDATVIKLEQNYRSTQCILDAANAVVANNISRKPKALWTANPDGEPVVVFSAGNEHEEAAFVASEVEELVSRGYSLADMAVLYRTNAQSRVIEEVFMRRDIPYVMYSGVEFYKRKEIKDIIAFLRLLVNPADDISFERVVNVPKRGIGKTSLERLQAFADVQGISLLQAAGQATNCPGLGKAAAAKLALFANDINDWKRMVDFLGTAELVEAVLDKSGYLDALREERTLEAQARLENLQEFVSVAKDFTREHGEQGLEIFLTNIELISDADTRAEGDAVNLLTLHTAKGLEYKVVFLLGMEEGVFPHFRSLADESELEEERRLCYVGITRAKERLFLSHAWQRMLYGKQAYNMPSRFLKELPGHLTDQRGFGGKLTAATTTVAPLRPQSAAVTAAAVLGGGGKTVYPAASRSFTDGERVMHQKFGPGTVVSSRGSGSDTLVTIAFDAAGIKTLSMQYTALEKLSEREVWE